MNRCNGIQKNKMICTNKAKYGDFCGVHIKQRVLPLVEEEPDIFGELEECCICLEDIQVKKNQIKTKCEHTFHKKCIQKWITKKTNCPMCRENIDVTTRKKIDRSARVQRVRQHHRRLLFQNNNEMENIQIQISLMMSIYDY